MGWPKLLVLVRHAESEGNLRTESERAEFNVSTHKYALTECGRKQAEITGQFLRSTFGDFDVRYVSYYERSKKLWRLCIPVCGCMKTLGLRKGSAESGIQ